MKRILISALAIGILAFPARADDTDNDVECVAIGLGMAASQDAVMKSSGGMVALYYLGRLDGRTPDLGLEDRLLSAIRGLGPNELRLAATRCSEGLKARGESLTAIGKDLQQKSAPSPASPPP
jgi:hypothetical protein